MVEHLLYCSYLEVSNSVVSEFSNGADGGGWV